MLEINPTPPLLQLYNLHSGFWLVLKVGSHPVHSCHGESSLYFLLDTCFCCMFTEYRTNLYDRNVPPTVFQDFSSLCKIHNISFPHILICHAWMQQLKFITLNNLSDTFSPCLLGDPEQIMVLLFEAAFFFFSPRALCLSE